MNYLDFFGLKEDPFKITPDPDYFFESLAHRKAKNLLEYTIYSREGFCVIIGEPGIGKTTVLKKFLLELPKNYITATIYNPMLSPEEFLKTLLDEFDIYYGENISKNEILKKISKFLEEKLREGKRALIVIDEAQLMPFETLEELRLLSNIETGKEKLIHIILVGQPELEEKLQDPKLRQLNNRITNKFFLDELTEDEVEKYIYHRLKSVNVNKIIFDRLTLEEIYKYSKGIPIVNVNKIIFDRLALEEIYKYSKGIPRLINLVASRTLMAAFVDKEFITESLGKDKFIIRKKHVLSAINALDKTQNKDNFDKKILPFLIVVFELMAILGIIIYIYLLLTKGV